MANVKYTRIEITQEAYEALEAEAILQGKTLKKLASELVLKGISKKALNFVQETTYSLESKKKISIELVNKVIEDIGPIELNIDKEILESVKNALLDEGYQGAMLFVAQNTASMQRDELFRVLTVCQINKVPSVIAADIIMRKKL
jgi:galactokinase/mevalonate kinase-like predicted kinase